MLYVVRVSFIWLTFSGFGKTSHQYCIIVRHKYGNMSKRNPFRNANAESNKSSQDIIT